MSKKLTIETVTSSMPIGVIVLDAPATVMSYPDIFAWDSALQPDDSLLNGCTYIKSLSPPGYTLWKGLI